MRFISDEKNVPVRSKEIVEIAKDGPDDEEEGHERTHYEEEDTGADEEEGGERYYENDEQCYEDDEKSGVSLHYERTMRNEMIFWFVKPSLNTLIDVPGVMIGRITRHMVTPIIICIDSAIVCCVDPRML